jgi:hypothetical protein
MSPAPLQGPSEGRPDDPYRDDENYYDERSSSAPAREHDALSALGVDEDPDSPPSPPSWPLRYGLAHRVPPGVTRAWEATKKWVKGPQPPRPWHIVPIAEKIQTWPIHMRDRYLPKRLHKIGALLLLYFLWLLTFSLVLHKSSFSTEVPGYGTPANIGCLSRFW